MDVPVWFNFQTCHICLGREVKIVPHFNFALNKRRGKAGNSVFSLEPCQRYEPREIIRTALADEHLEALETRQRSECCKVKWWETHRQVQGQEMLREPDARLNRVDRDGQCCERCYGYPRKRDVLGKLTIATKVQLSQVGTGRGCDVHPPEVEPRDVFCP